MDSILLNIPYSVAQYKIVTNDKNLLDTIQVLFYKFCCNLHKHNSEIIEIYKQNNDLYEVAFKQKKLLVESAIQWLHNTIYQDVAFEKHIIPLHACGISIDGKAHVFAGVSKSGKSTLAMHLCSKGYKYISDDCILYDSISNQIYPFPKPIYMRAQCLDYSSDEIDYLGNIRDSVYHRYIYIPKTIENNAIKLEKLYFVQYGNLNSCTKMPKPELAPKLFFSLYKPIHLDLNMIRAIDMIAQKYDYSICYTDFNYLDSVLERD